ncbi:MAG: ferrous iron transport protein A [Planctomycetaceae bacterium]
MTVFREVVGMTTLDSLKPGQTARIVSIEGQDGVAVRLMEMGLIDGEMIQLIGYAPFGDPIEFEVRGYRVSLRSTEARRVIITPDDSVEERD